MNNRQQNEINKIINGGAKKEDVDRLVKNLSQEDTKKLNEMLNDKQAMEKLLSNPKVQALIKMLGGKNNG